MRAQRRSYGVDLLTTLATALRTSENAVLMAIAALLGLVTALGIWLFREGIDLFHELFSHIQAALSPILGALAVVAALALAGALVGWIMDRFIGEERHHGVAGIMEAVALAGGRLRYRRMPFKAVASALSLGAGASVGPEDPSVQIGANLGSWFGKLFRVNEDHVRLLVAAGAASAISAAFKAPIAGVFFALEIVLNGAFETRSFGVIVLASVMSSALTQAIEPGSELGVFNFALSSPLEIPLFVPLGLLIGVVAVLFMRAVYWQHDLWHKYVHLPRPARTALAGALVGVVGIFLPQIMGGGRDVMAAVLGNELQLGFGLLIALAVFKILMTSVSLAGGFVGGIFAPSLFVGTMLGSLYGNLVQAIFPGAQLGSVHAYAIVGMAATMAGVVRSPITAIMLVFELTNDYRLILPIMLATVVCIYLAERLERYGIYTHGLILKGIRLPEGREIDLMQGVTVGEAMRQPAPTISEKASLTELRDALRSRRINSLCVVDDQGRLVGIVTLSDLQRAYAESRDKPDNPLTVGKICTPSPQTVYPDQAVWEAIRTMSQRDIGRLPVVERANGDLIGLLSRHSIVRAYNLAIARKREHQHVAEQIRLNTLTGGHIFEFRLSSGSALVGRKIRDIAWPIESAVVAIRRNGRLIVPRGDTELQSGDAITMLSDSAIQPKLAALFGAVEAVK